MDKPKQDLARGEPSASERAAADESTSKRFNVGVLFVHGIGEQPHGDTLIRFSQPVVDWVTKWVSQPDTLDNNLGPKRGEARLVKASLGPPQLRAGCPPHAVFEVDAGRTAGEFPPRKTTWLLAESWWAAEFRRPRFGELAGWLLTTGSWMILSHAGKSARMSGKKWKRGLQATRAFAVSLPLALLVQLLVAVLAVLAAVPIPKLRKALSGALLTLTGTLGDCFVLVSSPIQRVAAVSHLQKDLAWLSRRCDKIVLVAHSQGAAIAHEALRNPEPTNVAQLITVGSGLGKLEELRVLSERGRAYFLLSQIAIPLFALSAIFYPKMVGLYRGSDDMAAFALMIYPPILIIALLSLALRGADAYNERVRELSLEAVRPNLKWTDYFATADPVPNGPLAATDESNPGASSRPVVNFMSWTRDHSSYFQNRDEFVSCLVYDIDQTAESGLFREDQDIPRLNRARTLRRRRVRVLAALRLVAVLAIALALFGLRNELQSFGSALYDAFSKTPVLEVVSYILSGVGVAAQNVISRLVAIDPARLRSIGLAMLGATIPIGAVLIWNKLTFKLWKWWDNVSTRQLFNPAARLSNPADRVFVVGTSISAGLVPIAIACFAIAWPNPQELGGHVLSTVHTAGNYFMRGIIAIGVVGFLISIVKQAFSGVRYVWQRVRRRKLSS
ncbi:MAG TPA: hypothetical protein VLM38_15745 [Blastocatellia bacterium]|nr:hypothetical protein [Blastocatellia bacterium]